jgi:hypothetical protein
MYRRALCVSHALAFRAACPWPNFFLSLFPTPRPIATADECVACGKGFATRQEIGSTSCGACEPGSFSTGNAIECSICEVGRSSGLRSDTCTGCTPGKFAPDTGSPSCTKCPVGRFGTSKNATDCTDCEAGKYQTASGQTQCVDCQPGSFAATRGSATCESKEASPFSPLCLSLYNKQASDVVILFFGSSVQVRAALVSRTACRELQCASAAFDRSSTRQTWNSALGALKVRPAARTAGLPQSSSCSTRATGVVMLRLL